MNSSPRSRDLDPWTLGLLAGGKRGAARAAIAALCARETTRVAFESVFRVGSRDGLSSFEAAIYNATSPEGSTLSRIVVGARAVLDELRSGARELGLERRLPLFRLTSAGKAALAWYRERAQPMLVHGRAHGLFSMHPRDAALVCALFAPLRAEMHWADPRWAARIPEGPRNTFDAYPKFDIGRFGGRERCDAPKHAEYQPFLPVTQPPTFPLRYFFMRCSHDANACREGNMSEGYFEFFRTYHLRVYDFIRELSSMVYRAREGVAQSDVGAWVDNARRLLGLSDQLVMSAAQTMFREELQDDLAQQQRRLQSAQRLVREQIATFERLLVS